MNGKSKWLALLILGAMLLLCACGAAQDTGAKTAAPAAGTKQSGETKQTAEEAAPAEEEAAPAMLTFPDGSQHDPAETRLDLSTLTTEQAEDVIPLLQQMPDLRYVDLGEQAEDAEAEETEEAEDAETAETPEAEPRLSWAAIEKLQKACPNTDFDYRFTLFEHPFSTLDTAMDLNHTRMEDEGAAVKEVLPCMTKCTYLDMDFCHVSSPAMAEIRDAYPNMDVVWRIWFGMNCSVRTDVDTILASNLDHRLTDSNTEELKYCTRLKYLDIGHNDGLQDFSFMEYMPELKVAIICLSGLSDLNYVTKCTKLEFLEINTCFHLHDLSPLATMTNLTNLNICYLHNVTGYEALCNLTKLKRLWIGTHTHIPEEALEQIKAALPDTNINLTEGTGCGGTWKKLPGGDDPYYAEIRRIFDYDHYPKSCAAYWNDPKYLAPSMQH